MEITNEMINSAIEISNKASEILKEFNERLHSGKYTSSECYQWLAYQSHLHPEIPQFAFLYPEVISIDQTKLNQYPEVISID